MNEKITRKRLIANIEPEIHRRLKTMAVWKNMTITQYILQAIVRSLIEDEKHQ